MFYGTPPPATRKYAATPAAGAATAARGDRHAQCIKYNVGCSAVNLVHNQPASHKT